MTAPARSSTAVVSAAVLRARCTSQSCGASSRLAAGSTSAARSVACSPATETASSRQSPSATPHLQMSKSWCHEGAMMP